MPDANIGEERTTQRGIRTTQRIWSNVSPEFGLSRLEKVEGGCILLTFLGFDHVSPFILLFHFRGKHSGLQSDNISRLHLPLRLLQNNN